MPSIHQSMCDLLSELKDDLKEFESSLSKIASEQTGKDKREDSLAHTCIVFHQVFQAKLNMMTTILDTDEDDILELVKHQKLQDLLYS